MNNKSRKANSIINSSIGLISQGVIMIGQFILQTIFVKSLGSEYLGLNGLFANVLQFLSLAELGIGGAITFSLFGPIARNETDTIRAIMLLYRKIYRVIALLIFSFGVVFSFFIPYFIKHTTIHNVQLLFIIFLLNSVVSYFFSYRRTLLVADQRGSVDTANQAIFKIFQVVLQSLFLTVTHSFILYLVIQIILTISSNVSIFFKTQKLYPFLSVKKQEAGLNSDITEVMKKNVIGAFSAKIGSVIMYGTDNVLLAKFIGLTTVGIYSNYMLILNSISSLINQLLNPLASSIANYINDDTTGGVNNVFFRYMYVVNFVVLVVGGSLSVVVSLFVGIWLGKSYVISSTVLSLMLLNWMVNSMRTTILSFMTAVGTYWETRWKSLIESLANLAVGLALIMFTDLGVMSVVIGTLSANLLINVWIEPLILFKKQPDIDVKKYISRYALYFSLAVIIVVIPQFFVPTSNSIISFLALGLVSVVAFSMMYVVVTFRTDEFAYFYKLVLDLIVRKVR